MGNGEPEKRDGRVTGGDLYRLRYIVFYTKQMKLYIKIINAKISEIEYNQLKALFMTAFI